MPIIAITINEQAIIKHAANKLLFFGKKPKAKQGATTRANPVMVKMLFRFFCVINECIVENTTAKTAIQNSANTRYKASLAPKGKISGVIL